MMRINKFYGLLRGHANIRLTDKEGTKVYYEGSLNSMPDAYGDWRVIDFDAKNDLAGEVTYTFLVKR
ncbi:MAG: hypothetical protein Q4C04_03730 [Clostridia bacterium]|nr:hypothetical protein [Clostridia bacterium]